MYFLVAISALAFVIVLNLPQNRTSETKPTLKSQTTEATQGRIAFNFEKISQEDFREYKNQKMGISIRYPEGAELYEYSDNEIKQKSFGSGEENVTGAISISLVSQLAKGTELFDGLSLDLVKYSNSQKRSLREFVDGEIKILEEAYSLEKLELRKDIKVGSITGTEIVTSGWGGGYTRYYFISESTNNFIEIQIFSAGPDSEKFDEVANRVVSSFRYIP